MNVREPEEPGVRARPVRVVVGVDGSEASRAALRVAARSAAALGVGVGLVAVQATDGRAEGDPALLHGTVEQALAGIDAPPVEHVLRGGPAAEALVEESRDAELLVVGSRGHSGIAGVLLGSVSIACAERSRCPVLIVHAADARPHPVAGGEAPRVVVGVGDSLHGVDLLRIAERAAEALDAELLAVAVWDDTSVAPTVASQFGDELMTATRDAMDARIAEAFPAGRPAGLRAEIRQGQPAAVLIDESARADLVVVAASARGGFASALLGSVCLSVAEHAASPVLVVPAALVLDDAVATSAGAVGTTAG